MFGGFFLLRDRPQDVAGTRDMRQVDLRLNFVFAVNRRA
jgi:hypothetical protein